MSLRPRDMAKLGQLVLDGGTWRGQRIVSGDRVTEMTSRLVQFNPTEGYGYFWWTRTYPGEPDPVPSVRADGWGGQWIMVFPTLDLVAVFTGAALSQLPVRQTGGSSWMAGAPHPCRISGFGDRPVRPRRPGAARFTIAGEVIESKAPSTPPWHSQV